MERNPYKGYSIASLASLRKIMMENWEYPAYWLNEKEVSESREIPFAGWTEARAKTLKLLDDAAAEKLTK